MRIVVAVFALGPFVLVLLGMATGRARVKPCCRPTASDEHRAEEPRRSSGEADRLRPDQHVQVSVRLRPVGHHDPALSGPLGDVHP